MEESAPGKILLVDDDTRNLDLLRLMLEGNGYLVRTCTNGFDALDLTKKELPDLFFLDVMMPKMNGYQICERLKADPLTVDRPVIFLSGLSSIQEKIKAFTSGGVDYIVKPFDINEVLVRARTHLTLYRIQSQLASEVKSRTLELEQKNSELFEVNIVLKRLLKEIELEKQEVARTIQMNTEKLVLPDLDRMVTAPAIERIGLHEAITRSFQKISQPLITGKVDVYHALSPMELRVLNMLKQGRTTKEIAALFDLSPQTIATHRKNIRKKLDLSGKKINLTSYVTRQG